MPPSEAAIAEFLRRSSLFRDGPPDVARKVAPHIEVIEAPAGSLLVRAGAHEETAQLALEAAMTGHLVLTSIHADNASAAIQRFENFGCHRTVIAESMALILIQRSARRLCPQCTVIEEVPELLREALVARGLYDPEHLTALPRATGHDACDQTGFLGRVAVIESLRLTDPIRSMLMANRPLRDVIELSMQSGALLPFSSYASFMMEQRLIGPSQALLAVAS